MRVSSTTVGGQPPFLLVAGFAESILVFRGSLIRAILATGMPVHVAAPGVPRGAEIRLSLESLGVVVHDIPLSRTGTNPVADLWLSVYLYRLLRKIRPEVMLSYTIKPVIYGTLAGWLARVPSRVALVTGLGQMFTAGRSGFVAKVVGTLYKLALGRSRKVFFQNPDDDMLFRELGILSSAVPSVVVNGSGVDVSDFAPAAMPNGVAFLMTCRLIGEKGVREYVEAARRVKRDHPETRFRLVGWIDENPDGISHAELEAWIASGVIDFLGKLSDVRPAIADATVFVLPSYYREGTPRTVLEALAMGRPVITTDAPGCRETVIDGENGFLVPVRSVTALVDSMLKFIEDPLLAQRMGTRSRQIAEEKYDVHKVNAVMLREMDITPRSQCAASTHG